MQKGKKKQKLRVVADSKRGVEVYFYSDLGKREFKEDKIELSLDCQKSVKDTIDVIWKEVFPEEKVQGDRDRAILAIYRSEGMYLRLEKDRLLGYYGVEEEDKLFLYRSFDVMPVGHYYRLVSLD